MSASITAHLTAPTLPRILWGALPRFGIMSQSVNRIPECIGAYTLVEKAGSGSATNFFSGIYTDEAQKVFIKTWSGTFRNYQYYALVNEYLMSQIIAKKNEQLDEGLRITVPRVIDCLSTDTTVSLVYEFIDGKQLSVCSPEKKLEVLQAVRAALLTYTALLTPRERRLFMSRSGCFYVCSSLVILARFVVAYPRLAYKGVVLYMRALPSVVSLFRQPLVITHRDLTPRNIMLTDSKVHLIDLELMALAPQALEPEQMLLSYDYTRIRDDLRVALSADRNYFLCIRGVLLDLVDLKDAPEYSREYETYLAQLFADRNKAL